MIFAWSEVCANLTSLGLLVIRFTNDEIFNNIEKVLSDIKNIISEIQSSKSLSEDSGLLKSY